MFRRILGLAAVAAVSGMAGVASADPVQFSFQAVTANSVADVAIAESQLYMLVDGEAGGNVSFAFHNSGPAASSITDVYWDDMWRPILNDIVSIVSSAGVSFTEGADPSNLPGGNAISFTADFAADSNDPTQPMGVNPGEWVKFVFSLNATYTLDTVLAELSPSNTDLRVGIHVQGFADGNSESLVAQPPTPPQAVPIPAAVWGGAMLLGALGVGRTVRRRRDSEE